MKYKYNTKAEIPAGLEPFYKEVNGVWICIIEGVVPAETLTAEQQAAIALKKQLEAFSGLDPVKAKKLLEEAAAAQEDALKKAGKLDELVEARVTPYKTQLDQLKATVEAKEKALQQIILKSEVLALAPKFKVAASAVEDIAYRAEKTFTIVDGKVVAKDATGNVILSQKNPGQPLTPDEWFEGLAKSHPHYFAPSVGGGAGGSGSAFNPGSQGKENPFTKEGWNLSKQAELYKKDPVAKTDVKPAVTPGLS